MHEGMPLHSSCGCCSHESQLARLTCQWRWVPARACCRHRAQSLRAAGPPPGGDQSQAFRQTGRKRYSSAAPEAGQGWPGLRGRAFFPFCSAHPCDERPPRASYPLSSCATGAGPPANDSPASAWLPSFGLGWGQCGPKPAGQGGQTRGKVSCPSVGGAQQAAMPMAPWAVPAFCAATRRATRVT